MAHGAPGELVWLAGSGVLLSIYYYVVPLSRDGEVALVSITVVEAAVLQPEVAWSPMDSLCI